MAAMVFWEFDRITLDRPTSTLIPELRSHTDSASYLIATSNTYILYLL